MKIVILRNLLILFTCVFTGGVLRAQSITQNDPLILIVDTNTDLMSARDANPGDGVCSDMNGNCTLRAAVDEANAATGDVRIVLPGTSPGSGDNRYDIARAPQMEGVSLYEDNNEFGDLDLNGSFTSLHIQGSGTPGPTIRTNFSGNDRAFDIGDGKTVLIERIYFNQISSRDGSQGNQDGSGPEGVNGTDGGNGGAIRIGANCTFEADQVTFVQCTSGSGGQGVTPSSAASGTRGGDGGDGGDGGAIYIGSGTTATITRGTFQGCISGGGGGAGAAGGPDGMDADGGNGGNAGNGGAIYSAGNLTLRSCTLHGNEGVGGGGGGGAKGNGTSGFAGSDAQGGGVAIAQRMPGTQTVVNEGTLTILNNVIAKNEPSGPAQDLFQAENGNGITSQGFNMIGITAGLGNFTAMDSDILGGESNSLDPQASGIQSDEAWAVPVLTWGANSDAIDQGTTISDLDYDARGFQRGAMGNTPDRGAWEFEAAPIEDNLRITEIDVNTSDGNGEFIEIQNQGDYALQIDDYAFVAFGPDGMSCFVRNGYGEVAPGAYFVIGDENVSNRQQTFSFGAFDSSCGGDPSDEFNNASGSVAIYEGIADSYNSTFEAGTRTDTRRDQLAYDNSDGATAQRSLNFSPVFDFCKAFTLEGDCTGRDSGDGESISKDDLGNITSGSPSPGNDAFSLPVSWQEFTGIPLKNSVVQLDWTTANEFQNAGFGVEHSRGTEWTEVDWVEGAGSAKQENAYRTYVEGLSAGEHLFRLRQQDFDGTVEYSQTISVKLNASQGEGNVLLFPNPVRETLRVGLNSARTSGTAEVSIHSVNGRILSTAQLPATRGVHSVSTAELPAGTYFLTVINGDSKTTRMFKKM